jgi:hypothetical protein
MMHCYYYHLNALSTTASLNRDRSRDLLTISCSLNAIYVIYQYSLIMNNMSTIIQLNKGSNRYRSHYKHGRVIGCDIKPRLVERSIDN